MSLSQLSLIMSHSFPFFHDFPICLHHFAHMFSIFVHIIYIYIYDIDIYIYHIYIYIIYIYQSPTFLPGQERYLFGQPAAGDHLHPTLGLRGAARGATSGRARGRWYQEPRGPVWSLLVDIAGPYLRWCPSSLAKLVYQPN